eukprot:6486708-Amphidinium_carterae.1
MVVSCLLGPLYLFTHIPLYVAYLGQAYRFYAPVLPKWTRASICRFLHLVAQQIPNYLSQPRRRRLAWKRLDNLLKLLSLPPRLQRPFPVHFLVHHKLKAAVRSAVNCA